MKRYTYILLLFFGLSSVGVMAQDIPVSLDYTRLYDYIDELATDGVITLNSIQRPYSRIYIAEKLEEALRADSLLNRRQYKDLLFFLNDYALERDTIPDAYVQWTNHKSFSLALLQPAFFYYDKNFKARLNPIVGMDVYASNQGLILKRWWGASFEATIVNHVSVWGSMRDISYNGTHLKDKFYPTIYDKIDGAKLTKPNYLNTLPGCEYKEANYGADYSDLQGGIKAYAWWGSIGLVKDRLVWGDGYQSSNILSGRAPSFPMLTMSLTPCKWFRLNYIHGWLNSNVIDTTAYYIEETYTDTTAKLHYRVAPKYIAANMLTFTPVRGLDLSIGNAIIYGENSPQAAYFIPIAFYKSLDHLLTKGANTGNQNSMVYINVSSRNLDHLHVYGSIFIDEFSFKRLKPSVAERNPISYQVGVNVTNWPLQNLSVRAEYTATNIIVYKHSIQRIDYTSNGYNLGHFMGDNAQAVYASMVYSPIRGLQFKLDYTMGIKYLDYEYVRREIRNIISQKPFHDATWRTDQLEFQALYEVVNNAYAVVNVRYGNTRGIDATSDEVKGEVRRTAAESLAYYTPGFYRGETLSVMFGFSFYF